MIPEAPLEQTEHGLMAAGKGWFVLNAREARWFKLEGRGLRPGLQGKGDFPQLGIGLYVLGPGEPMAMYHWETDQEAFSSSPGRLCSSSRARSGDCGSGISCTAPPGRST